MDSNDRAPRTPWDTGVPARSSPSRRPTRPARRSAAAAALAAVVALALAACAPAASAAPPVPSFDARSSSASGTPSDGASAHGSGATASSTATAGSTPTAPPGTGGATPQPGSFDEFDGPAGSAPDPAHWTAQTGAGGWGNKELQTYTASNGVLDGQGHLVITADIGPDGGPPYTSARLTTHGKASFGFGTVSARIKLPQGGSLVPAFWMLGSDIDSVGWPECGEIDVVEAPIDTHRTSHFLHGPATTDPHQNLQAGGILMHHEPMSDGYHVYSITRTPGHVVISVDGVVGTDITEASAPSDLKWVFDGQFDLVLSLAIGGSVPHPTASTPRTAQMLVDWVRYAPAS